jgi:serine/threonine protein kinase/lipopolysaccharide biosynthesis regulator YciM
MADKSTFGAKPEGIDRLLLIGLDEFESKEEASVKTFRDQFLERPGDRIGPYKLLRVLGEGGMGIVYLAEQEEPIKRQVALKVIKPGMDSKRVIARFEAERQVLALLDHPNIAHIYDAGMTDSDRPYFVMEYVEGLTITEHCDRHKLTIEDRLNLFRQVCLAVHHAHQKGIIHRDIKSSNIIVSMQDDKAVPKIIDFGVAKAISQSLIEKSLLTENGQLFGTPEYMSPEQADMANEDIDTRADVYSLGVLLYVLLTGVLPFDSATFREGGIEQIRKVVRETDPKTPSTRLSSLGEQAEKVAQSRQMEVVALTKCLHRELEWIPLKAMRKERAERYRSASEFVDDIENYLKGDPLIAGPPSTIYRLKKLVRRNRALVIGIAAVLAVLAVGVVVSTILAIGQAHALAEAERQAKISETVSSFLRDDLLGSLEPDRSGGRDVTVRSILDNAMENLGKFKNEPLVEASLRDTIGWTYRELGELKVAKPHLERAVKLRREQLGAEHPDTLHSVRRLGGLYWSQGRYKESAKLLEKALLISQRVLGIEHITTLGITQGLATAYIEIGRYDEAEQFYLKCIPIAQRMPGEKNEWSLHMLAGLGITYECQGRYDEAERQFIELLRLREGFWDDENIHTLQYKGLLARVYRKQKRYIEAESLYLEILPIQRKVDGDEHWRTLRSMNGLAQVYTHLGKYNQAEKLFDEAMKSYESVYGREHGDTIRCMNGLAKLYTAQRRFKEAKSLLIEVLEISSRKLGKDHPWTLTTMNNLALIYKEQGLCDEAEPLFIEAFEGRRLKLGDTHPHTIESIKSLIDLYETWNKPGEAEKWRLKLPQTEAKTE